ncbi:hydrolase [Planococcus antarcticus DSM 14505]|uniref:Hydrolase n=1 Tax=Planococcus antarcticus DSM 14505 TaxID=1185653 RepID=A0A1C7DBL6_9BACL|nr:HAD-IIB family hydrolase [Planococcus antarcticus]ANU08889.1 hydrolase [Planococcus antarcticus DSM 14505]EIM06423.1 hydrolase [Planococcus antarcticus DSM 14505]
MLATDLDGTLVGDKFSLMALLDFYGTRTYKVSLIYITGRHYQSALSLIAKENLPVPQVLITDVGTGIYTGDSLQQEMAWTEQLEQAWMPDKIDSVASQISGLVSQNLPIANRCSYFASDSAIVEVFRAELDKAGIPHKLIYSGGRDVDILPIGSGKGQALQYILDKYNLSEAKLLVAGDSGNDVEMLTMGFPSVIVGNAQPELLEQAEHPSIYRAQKKYAGGIHEAWSHFYTD